MRSIFHSSSSKYSLIRNFECDAENAVSKLPSRKLAIPIAIFVVFIILIYYSNQQYAQIKKFSDLIEREQRDFEYFSQWLKYDPKLRIKPEFDRFIYTNTMDGGLGNQMYRFAAIFAMGQFVNRTPVFLDADHKMREIDSEIGRGFPNFHRRIYFIKSGLNESEIDKIEPFDEDCCDFIDPKIIYGHNERRFLWLNGKGGNFENSKYFHKIRPKIVKLFEFGEEIVKNITTLIREIAKNDSAYKICVHTRNGDFAGLGESRADQVGPAIDRIIRHLPSMTNGQFGIFSLVLFGEDKELLHSLKFDKNALQSSHFVADMKLGRIGELFFAQQICDLFLDTASLSSFAFWMGYLMPENRPKFFIRKHIRQHSVDTFEMLPPEWFPIEEDWLK